MRSSLVFSMGHGGLQGHPRRSVHLVTLQQGHPGTGAGQGALPCSGAALCSPPQAGGKHYHPTCARCVRCHQMFTEGEEMYLTGRAVTSVAGRGLGLGLESSVCSSVCTNHCSP